MQIPYSAEQGIIFGGTGNLGAGTGNFIGHLLGVSSYLKS
jgi:hypothetical protein